MSQPGVADPLHPEEPTEVEDAWQWLDNRAPNGDARVVCGQVTLDGTRYICGFTFTGRHSFTPFAETRQQVERDLAAGATYLEGDVWANVDDATPFFPNAQGAVWFSRSELDSWASPMTDLEREADGCLRDEDEVWRGVARSENIPPGYRRRWPTESGEHAASTRVCRPAPRCCITCRSATGLPRLPIQSVSCRLSEARTCRARLVIPVRNEWSIGRRTAGLSMARKRLVSWLVSVRC